MPSMRDGHPTSRGDLMRRMAAIHVQIDLLLRGGKRDDQSQEKQQELPRQLADLGLKM
jgi:hypothetical protein